MKTIDFNTWCETDKKGKIFFYHGCKYTLCDYADNVNGRSCYVVYNHETERHSVWDSDKAIRNRKIVVYIND